MKSQISKMLKIRLKKNKDGFFEPVEIYQDQENEPQDISPALKRRARKNHGRRKTQKNKGKGKNVTLSPLQSNIQLISEKNDFDDTLFNEEIELPPIHSTIQEGKKFLKHF